MVWLVFTILLVIIGTVGLIGGFVASTSEGTASGFGTFGLSIVVWLILTLALSVHGVGQRKVGIVYNFAGVITGKRDPGYVWTAPWQHIRTANVGLQQEVFDLGTDNSAVSSDQQPIFARISCNYQVSPKNILDLYREVGPGWKEILLDARLLQDFKEITSTYTAAEITTKRPELRAKTTARLASEMSKYDITNIACFIKNLGYTEAYRDAINEKNVQVQKALQAEAKVAQSRAEADQKAAEADGERRAAIARAEGNSESIRLEGKALRNNPEVLRLRAIEKLNPNAQVIICTGKTCPSFLPQFSK